MAKIIMREVKGNLRGAEGKQYPHLLKVGTISTSDLAANIADMSSLSRGDVKGVLAELSLQMSKAMALGFSVDLEGIGVFRPLAKLVKDAEPGSKGSEMNHNRARICIGNVSYRPDQDLLRECNLRSNLERVMPSKRSTNKNSGRLPKMERMAFIKKWLSESDALTVKRYAQYTGMSSSSASRELKSLSMGITPMLRRTGRGSHVVYREVK